MIKTMQETGLEFSTESMAQLVMDSRHEDLECFLDKTRGVWVIRYWRSIPDFNEPDGEQWGAVHEATTLCGVLTEYVHGAHFS